MVFYFLPVFSLWNPFSNWAPPAWCCFLLLSFPPCQPVLLYCLCCWLHSSISCSRIFSVLSALLTPYSLLSYLSAISLSLHFNSSSSLSELFHCLCCGQAYDLYITLTSTSSASQSIPVGAVLFSSIGQAGFEPRGQFTDAKASEKSLPQHCINGYLACHFTVLSRARHIQYVVHNLLTLCADFSWFELKATVVAYA